MRLTVLMVILVAGCGTPEPMTVPGDAGPTSDAVSYDGSVEDGGSDAGEDARVPLDTGVFPVVDAGVDAASETDAGVDGGVDAGTDAAVLPDAGSDGGSDAGPPPPPARPSGVVEFGDSRCFRDADSHAWCLRGSPLAPVYVGDADRVFGECALAGDEVRCVGASGMLEPNGQRGVQIAQHSTSTRGCVIPASRDRAVCWFSTGDVWTFTGSVVTFVDAAVPPGTGAAPAVVALLFHYDLGGIDTVRQVAAGPPGGGSMDLGTSFGVTFSEPVVTWGSNGNGLCWLGTGGQVRCRATWNGADGVPISGGTRWTAFDQTLVCADDFCRSPGSSLSGGFFGGALRHVELGEVYAYDAPSTIRGTDLRSTWTATW